MKSEDMLEAIGGIDDYLVAQAINDSPEKKTPTWLKWAAVAACLVLILTGQFVLAGLDPKLPVIDTHPTLHFSTDIQLSGTPVTAESLYPIITDSAWFTLDYAALAQNYIISGARNDFITAYETSDRVAIYPIFGTYLETTGSALYVFYWQGTPYAIGQLTFDSQGTLMGSPEFRDMTVWPEVVAALSLEDCYSTLVGCSREQPDFDILGLVRSTQGYGVVYPVGIQAGDNTIKYVMGEPCAFCLVEPFETLEAGYRAFQAYVTQRRQTLSEITVFPWKEETFCQQGYLREFEATYPQKDRQYAYLDRYDSVVAVPLLSEGLEENVYTLHLLYYRNQLIAELILERGWNGTASTYTPVWHQAAEQTAEGDYVPMESTYVSILKQAAKHMDWTCQGVAWNGKLMPVGVQANRLMAYNVDTDLLTAYDTVFPQINVDQLKKKYPDYFGLPTEDGLAVYIWQMAEGSYSCVLLAGKDRPYSHQALWDLHQSAVSMEEMRAIVASYFPAVSREDVAIRATVMPHSSYAYTLDDVYCEKLAERFWAAFPE